MSPQAPLPIGGRSILDRSAERLLSKEQKRQANHDDWSGNAPRFPSLRYLVENSRPTMEFFRYRKGDKSMRSPQFAHSKEVIDAWVQVSDDSRATALEISLQVASMFPPMSPWEVMLTVAAKTDNAPTSCRPSSAASPNAD